MLNERQRKIITLLREEKKWKTGRELASIFNVSDRTIRSDIEHINESGNTLLIESNTKFGYKMCLQAIAVNTFCVEKKIPQTSQQRCKYIIYKLMFVNEEVSLYQITEELFISQNSIEKELKEVKNIISAYSTLNIVRKKNYISLQGEEHQKRKMYAELLSSIQKGNILNLDNLEREFEGISVSVIRRELKSILEKYQYFIPIEEIIFLVIRISVSLKRMARQKYIKNHNPEDSVNWKSEYSAEYAIIKEFFEKMRKYSFIIGIPESEIIYSALLLYSTKETTRDDIKELQVLINDIIQDIDKRFGIDLSNDEKLRFRLINHIAQMIARKKKQMESSVFYMDEIKGRYPLFFEMAACAAKVIQEKENIDIDEDDISFLAQHIGASLENTVTGDKYRVLIIYSMNQALFTLCIGKIEKIFYDRIEIIGCDYFFEEKRVRKQNPDMIITTLPLQHDLKILTIQISLFVSIDDKAKIFQAINYMDKDRDKLKFQRNIGKMMEKRFFFLDLDMETPKEVIKFLCDKLEKAGCVGKDFLNEVIKREQLSPTSFVYSFAVPHPLLSQSIKSKIAVAILKRPIQWGEFSVRLVLMLAIGEIERKELSTFFEWLGGIVNDSGKISSLMNSQSFEEFIDKINS